MMTLQWQGSGFKEKVAFYGGAFDPLTVAHENVCKKIHEELGLDVWISPCYGHRFGKVLTDPLIRLEMVSEFANRHEWCKESYYEIQKRLNGSTFNTLEALSGAFPKIEFCPVIGLDNAIDIQKWQSYELLLQKYSFIVIGRGGYQTDNTWFLEKPHYFIEMNLEVSSTQVRDLIRNHELDEAKSLVSKSTWKIIQKNNLFGENNG